MINKILNFFFGKREIINTGALRDDRTELQKEGAYDARELVTASQVEWKEKTSWKRYPVKRQYYTGECVAQSTTKHLGINNERETGQYQDLSAGFFYWFRVNKGTAGMIWADAMKIATTIGSCLGFRVKQRIRDSDIEVTPTEEMKKEALKYKGKLYIEDKERSLDSIARIIDSRGSCLIWFWFDESGKEWWKVEPSILYPNLGTYSSGATRHALVATDYGIRNGKKVIKIEDSAGNSSAENEQDRFIDENFIKRCFVSGYVIDEPNKVIMTVKPTWIGTRILKVGMSGEDVKTLQQILAVEGCYNFDKFTGFLGGITKAGIIKLQEKYKTQILVPAGLNKGTGVCGKFTLEWLKNNYGV